ncbi:hypothetical protein EDB19DRAFT_2022684 [Suillus lakei]|nr:hypothetical protein EDB19DRAFT_2022684 [Suillus lakei]
MIFSRSGTMFEGLVGLQSLHSVTDEIQRVHDNRSRGGNGGTHGEMQYQGDRDSEEPRWVVRDIDTSGVFRNVESGTWYYRRRRGSLETIGEEDEKRRANGLDVLFVDMILEWLGRTERSSGWDTSSWVGRTTDYSQIQSCQSPDLERMAIDIVIAQMITMEQVRAHRRRKNNVSLPCGAGKFRRATYGYLHFNFHGVQHFSPSFKSLCTRSRTVVLTSHHPESHQNSLSDSEECSLSNWLTREPNSSNQCLLIEEAHQMGRVSYIMYKLAGTTTKEHSSAMKQRPLCSTSKCVTMTVLCSSGLWTMSTGILSIRRDRINAERQLIEEANSEQPVLFSPLILNNQTDQHAQRAALFAKAALEMGSSMDTTDSDDDDDSSSDDDEPRHVHNLFSAYALLRLNSSFKKQHHDQWMHATCHANMHHAWNLQLLTLADAYLHWKHIGRHDTEPDLSGRQFHISTVDSSSQFAPSHNTMKKLQTLHCFDGANHLSAFKHLRKCCHLYANILRTISNAFDIYLAILREIRSRTDAALGQIEPNWHLRHSCPPCTFKQPDEPNMYPESLKAMDGNNSAKRMATAGHADHRKFTSWYMITSEDVDVFKDDVRLRPGERGTDTDTNNPLACTDNWKAANLTNENTRCDVVYPLATINKLLDVVGHNQAIGTDIGCSLVKTVAASSIHAKAADHRLLLAVNAFHGHAHNHKCQLQHHPLYLGGFGLEDLETCERIFAGSNAAASLIRHASHFHYVQYLDFHFDQWDADKYLELSHLIFNNYRQALTIITDNTKELEAYRLMYPDKVLDFDSWIDEELAYLRAVGSEPQHDALTVEYVDALEKLAKYEHAFNSSRQDPFVSYNQSSFTPNSGLSISVSQATKQGHAARHATEHQLQVQINIIEDLEIRLGVSEHWMPDHEEYVKALEYSCRRHFICAVEELESLVVQRLFELSKANLASTGYKLRKQISKAIMNRSGAIRTVLDNDVVSYVVLGEFDLLKYSQHNILTKPWANPTHCEMTVKHFKVLCVWEEIIRLNVEICRLQAWVITEDANIERVAADLESTNGLLAAELQMLAHCRRRINNVHRECLMRTYHLEGYTGCAPITSLNEGNSSEIEEADDEESDDDRDAHAYNLFFIPFFLFSLKMSKNASTFPLESEALDGHLLRPLHRLAYLDLAFADDDTDLVAVLILSTHVEVRDDWFKGCWKTVELPSDILHDNHCISLSNIKTIGPVNNTNRLAVHPPAIRSEIDTAPENSNDTYEIGVNAKTLFAAYCLPCGVIHDLYACINEHTRFEREHWQKVLEENLIDEPMQSSILEVIHNVHAGA